MPKNRTPISAELAADVTFASDRTCCVCRERGKAVQIHHIDEDPANNVFENLALLWLQCHDDTQTKGGFGRKLDSELVVKYRDEWLLRIKRRRDDSDKIAVSKTIGITERIQKIATIPYTGERADTILEYVNSLPALHMELLRKAQPEWDSGVTARMVEASYEYIDALQSILVTLSKFYPQKTFLCYVHEQANEQFKSAHGEDVSRTLGFFNEYTCEFHVIYNDVIKEIEDYAGPHELVHAIARKYIGANIPHFWSEGLAMYLCWDRKRAIEFYSAEMLHSGALSPLDQLLDNKAFKKHYSFDAYNQAAIFSWEIWIPQPRIFKRHFLCLNQTKGMIRPTAEAISFSGRFST